MPFYRIDHDDGTQSTAHLNFGRAGRGPLPCAVAPFPDDTPLGRYCARPAVALCDGPGGVDLAGTPATCDMPVCEKHRTRGGKMIDYCPRHRQLAQKD